MQAGGAEGRPEEGDGWKRLWVGCGQKLGALRVDGRARVQEGTQEKGTARRRKGLGRDAGGLAEKAEGETPLELSVSRGGG